MAAEDPLTAELKRKLRKLDTFLDNEFGSGVSEMGAVLGVFVARLVCRHGWNSSVLERFFRDEVEEIRAIEVRVASEKGN